jgi:hypothetical protein
VKQQPGSRRFAPDQRSAGQFARRSLIPDLYLRPFQRNQPETIPPGQHWPKGPDRFSRNETGRICRGNGKPDNHLFVYVEGCDKKMLDLGIGMVDIAKGRRLGP